jgi:putative peptidoglycan lipid II flippase
LSGTTLVDQAVASTLEPGSVATLSYGTRIVLLVTALGAAALGTAVLPFFSRMVAASDWDHLRRTMRTFAVLTLLITLPCAAVLYHFSAPIVSLVFERGAFTPDDTALVSRVQALYALQLPFFGVGILYSRLISSLGANRLLLVQAGICLAVDAALAFGLSRLLGVAGIALGTSVMYAVALGLLAIMGRRALAAVSLGEASSQKPITGPAVTT